ncbi:MAG: LLM class flavin-dependent oxidoreductase, partial [Acidimicrobiia bacterium]|nr:LLM class flavin-dependent oxidoreductase [Acidimicrobiia bacterium]
PVQAAAGLTQGIVAQAERIRVAATGIAHPGARVGGQRKAAQHGSSEAALGRCGRAERIAGAELRLCRDCPIGAKHGLALYVGGMGAKDVNFHYEVLARIGWQDVCARVQDLYLDGRKEEAQKAIPLEMVEDVALVGPPEKIAAELPRWKETVVTTMAVQGPPELLRAVADLVLSE